MVRGQVYSARLFGSANPRLRRCHQQAQRIIADELSRTCQFKTDGVIGERTDRVEFVRNTKNDASGVGSIGHEFGVVGQQCKFLIDALAGETSRDDLVALDEPVNAQIAPTNFAVATGRSGKQRVFKMRELRTVGIGLAD